jgi:DNA repair protein SbcC/Rad50
MKILNLKLENFKQIKNADINFTNGITLISGDNGSGKTSILEAISLLIADHTKKTLKDLINWNSNYFNISIEFEHLGKNFKENFYYSEKKSERELYIDSVNVGKGNDATEKLSEYINPKLSLASAISAEGEIDIISVRPAERREHLKKIYNLDFSKGIEDLDLKIKKIENEDIQELTRKIYFLDNKKYNIEEIRILPFDEKEYLSKKELLESNKLIKANYENQLKEYESKKYELYKVEKEIEEIQANNKTTENKISQDKEDILFNNNRKIDNEKRYNDFIIQLNKKIEVIDSELNNIKLERLEAFDENLLKIENKNKYDIETLIKENNSKISLCKLGKCPTCGNVFDQNDISEYQNNIDNYKSQLREIEFKIESLEKQKLEYDNNRKLQENFKLKKQELENNKAANLKEIENLKNNLLNETEHIEASNKKSNEDIIYLANSLEKSKIKLADIIIKLDILKKDTLNKPELSTDIVVKIINLENEIKSYEEILIINKKIEENNAKVNSEKIIDEKEKSALQGQRELLYSEAEQYKKGKVILQKEFPNFVLAVMTKSLEYGLNEFINKTYAGRYKLKLIDKKDSIYVVYGENEKDIICSSGYERQLFNLAWKFALGKLQNLKIIILDEPDSQATESNSQILFKIIGEMKELYSQIIVITHREETKTLLESEYNAKILIVENSTIK